MVMSRLSGSSTGGTVQEMVVVELLGGQQFLQRRLSTAQALDEPEVSEARQPWGLDDQEIGSTAPAFPHTKIGALPPGSDVPLRNLAPPRPDIHVDMAPFPDVVVEALQSGEIAAGLWKPSSSHPRGRGR